MSKKGKYSVQDEKSFFDNAIDTLVANIRFAAVDIDIQTICITSSVPNEGKSTISVGLAQALANQGRRVLVVENDLHRRSLGTMLGVHARYGLYSVLMGQVQLAEAVVPAKVKNLDFLDCEPHIPNPSNVLASKRYRNFIAYAKQGYDYVVIDTPPVQAYVDSAIVGALCDAVLLVARQNFVKRDEVAASIDQLRKADANVIGTVMNFVPRESSSYYYYGYYTKEGKKVSSTQGVPQLQQSAEAADLPADGPMEGGAAAGMGVAPAAAARSQAQRPHAQVAPQAQQPAPARAAAATRQAQASGANAAQSVQPARPASTATRKPAPDSTEQFMIDAGYFKNTQSKS